MNNSPSITVQQSFSTQASTFYFHHNSRFYNFGSFFCVRFRLDNVIQTSKTLLISYINTSITNGFQRSVKLSKLTWIYLRIYPLDANVLIP